MHSKTFFLSLLVMLLAINFSAWVTYSVRQQSASKALGVKDMQKQGRIVHKSNSSSMNHPDAKDRNQSMHKEQFSSMLNSTRGAHTMQISSASFVWHSQPYCVVMDEQERHFERHGVDSQDRDKAKLHLFWALCFDLQRDVFAPPDDESLYEMYPTYRNFLDQAEYPGIKDAVQLKKNWGELCQDLAEFPSYEKFWKNKDVLKKVLDNGKKLCTQFNVFPPWKGQERYQKWSEAYKQALTKNYEKYESSWHGGENLKGDDWLSKEPRPLLIVAAGASCSGKSFKWFANPKDGSDLELAKGIAEGQQFPKSSLLRFKNAAEMTSKFPPEGLIDVDRLLEGTMLVKLSHELAKEAMEGKDINPTLGALREEYDTWLVANVPDNAKDFWAGKLSEVVTTWSKSSQQAADVSRTVEGIYQVTHEMLRYGAMLDDLSNAHFQRMVSERVNIWYPSTLSESSANWMASFEIPKWRAARYELFLLNYHVKLGQVADLEQPGADKKPQLLGLLPRCRLRQLQTGQPAPPENKINNMFEQGPKQFVEKGLKQDVPAEIKEAFQAEVYQNNFDSGAAITHDLDRNKLIVAFSTDEHEKTQVYKFDNDRGYPLA
eukprot:gnl/MRDRNA2_/MRDRNA2_26455_c0_seq1.p1 gnl/MRDRNA2_/MRDRNA2_26455_c0~~gnl/MRDRNA2_/MRDRNA2_26455_c0_seq1.p1  ORF type:complete len:603 (-),score=82.64 gnl/MRDRNA2_/MRDRNA2_26455_c0_seq1:5-1813(-)